MELEPTGEHHRTNNHRIPHRKKKDRTSGHILGLPHLWTTLRTGGFGEAFDDGVESLRDGDSGDSEADEAPLPLLSRTYRRGRP